jgi:hypothetical protein
MPDLPAPKRPRGAQPGNANAIKQGFYARQFRRAEIKDLQNLKTVELSDEISMLRVFMRRIVEKSNPDAPISEDIEILRVLSVAALSLSRLIRSQLVVTQSTFKDSLDDILKEVWDDMKRKDPELAELWK